MHKNHTPKRSKNHPLIATDCAFVNTIAQGRRRATRSMSSPPGTMPRVAEVASRLVALVGEREHSLVRKTLTVRGGA